MTRTKPTVLVVDDEPGVRQVLSMLLKTEGFDVVEAADGRECLRLAYQHRPDLVLLDIMMPDRDGREVCRRLREVSNMPIVMLTALSETREKVDRLHDGADDYMTKPFHNDELVARLLAVLRRSNALNSIQAHTYQDGYLDIDFEARRLQVQGIPVTLSPKQWRLLECLVGHKDRIVPRADLLHYVWGDGYEAEHCYLKVFISHLRQKLGDTGRKHHYIHTERERGYRFESHA